MPLIVALGLLAAFLFATATTLQQRAARIVTAARPHHPRPGWALRMLPILRVIGELVRHRIWLLGWTANLVGFMAQATALYLGSVAVVQPILVTQVLFTLPMVCVPERTVPRALDWLSAAAVSGGLAILLSVEGAAPWSGVAHRDSVALASLAAAGAILLLLTLASGRSGLRPSTLAAIAAGLCFALTAVFVKLTAYDLVHGGVVATALSWPGYALAASAVCGLLIAQGVAATGSLPWAVAAMGITNPVASYLIGVLAFDVQPPHSAGTLAAVAGAGALIALGITGLAHSPLIRSGFVATDRPAARPLPRADVRPSAMGQ